MFGLELGGSGPNAFLSSELGQEILSCACRQSSDMMSGEDVAGLLVEMTEAVGLARFMDEV